MASGLTFIVVAPPVAVGSLATLGGGTGNPADVFVLLPWGYLLGSGIALRMAVLFIMASVILSRARASVLERSWPVRGALGAGLGALMSIAWFILAVIAVRDPASQSSIVPLFPVLVRFDIAPSAACSAIAAAAWWPLLRSRASR